MNMIRIQAAILVALSISVTSAYADTPSQVSEVALVKDYMLKTDYPEKFSNHVYHVKILDAIVAPVLNDGSDDVVILVAPNYRQSATILFYKISETKTVTRVMEGLAPGPLVPVTGNYIDSHTLGEGVDLSLQGRQEDTVSRRNFIDVAAAKFGGMVAYPNFFHVDGRQGPLWYVDESNVMPVLENKDCSGFEFSAVEAVAVGQITGGGTDNYLIAKVGDSLYTYLISGLESGKFLNKKSWTSALPADFKSFMPEGAHVIQYQTVDGQAKDLVKSALVKE